MVRTVPVSAGGLQPVIFELGFGLLLLLGLLVPAVSKFGQAAHSAVECVGSSLPHGPAAVHAVRSLIGHPLPREIRERDSLSCAILIQREWSV